MKPPKITWKRTPFPKNNENGNPIYMAETSNHIVLAFITPKKGWGENGELGFETKIEMNMPGDVCISRSIKEAKKYVEEIIYLIFDRMESNDKEHSYSIIPAQFIS